MITLTGDNENWIFEITGDDIYDYIESFFEDRVTLVLVNELIDNHNLTTARESCKLLLIKHRYYDIILDGLEKIITKQGSVIRTINKKKATQEEEYDYCLYYMLDQLYTKYK